MTLQTDYPVKAVCEVLDVPRSTFYHTSAGTEDGDLRAALLDLAGHYPTYGYRRLTVVLKRAGWMINHQRIQRIMAEMGLQHPVKWRTKRTTNHQHDAPLSPNLVADRKPLRPDHV